MGFGCYLLERSESKVKFGFGFRVWNSPHTEVHWGWFLVLGSKPRVLKSRLEKKLVWDV